MRAHRFIRESLALRDGRKVVLRPIRPEDAPKLIELHDRLSTDSQYYRFFGPKPRLSPGEAAYLANVDFHRRFAIVAVDGDDVVAVGRFDIQPDGSAEPAIVVRDDHQGVGLGKAILERMREVARGRGVERFSAEILAENRRMLQLMSQSGLDVNQVEEGVVRVTAPIDDLPLMFKGFRVATRFAAEVLDRNPLRRDRQSS
jgi:GNAT superfamily N-acetyltransferase